MFVLNFQMMILTKEIGMRCKVCGRDLKNSVSRQAGYGPICYRKVFGSSLVKRKESNALKWYNKIESENIYCLIPGQMNIEDYLQSNGMT